MSRIITTRAGYERLLERLQAALRMYGTICDSNSDAAGDGDTSVWHDNFAYEHNQREMHRWACRITEIKGLLSRVQVVEISQNPTKVQIGCVVVLQDEDEEKDWAFEVAGYEDGDIENMRVSYMAPLMQHLMGKEVGDECEVFLDNKSRSVTITQIKTPE